MKLQFTTLVFALSFILHFPVMAQCDWELQKEKDGIAVYTCKIPESSFKAFKAITNIKANSVIPIVAAILDVNSFPAWMPDTEEAQILKQVSDGHVIYYVRTGAPWPVNDRDGIYEQEAFWFKDKNRVVIELNVLDNYDFPMDNKVVRMNIGSGFWEIKEADKGNFKIIYQYHADPGGSIPAWLANTSVVNIPFEVLENLNTLVEEGKYNDAQLDFID